MTWAAWGRVRRSTVGATNAPVPLNGARLRDRAGDSRAGDVVDALELAVPVRGRAVGAVDQRLRVTPRPAAVVRAVLAGVREAVLGVVAVGARPHARPPRDGVEEQPA